MSGPGTEFNSQDIGFSYEAQEVDLDQVLRLLDGNAFWARERHRDDMELAIRSSDVVVSAWYEGTLVGFGRATSDRIYRAVLWDVVVDSQFRRQGIGRRLVEALIAHPHLQQVEKIYLFTSRQQDFYQRIGFEENPSTTLVWVNDPLHPQIREPLRSLTQSRGRQE